MAVVYGQLKGDKRRIIQRRQKYIRVYLTQSNDTIRTKYEQKDERIENEGKKERTRVRKSHI